MEPAPLTGSFKDLLHLVQFLVEGRGAGGGPSVKEGKGWQNGNFGISQHWAIQLGPFLEGW